MDVFALREAVLRDDMDHVRGFVTIRDSKFIAAASLDESRWTPLTRLLLDAGLIVKEGDRRTARYKLP